MTAPGDSPDSPLAILRVRSGLPADHPLVVRDAQATIGSDPSSDVVIAADGVALRHSQLRLRGGVWTYIDFGSPSGSLVDGEPVRGEALLAPGSSLAIGSVQLAFDPQDRWEDSPVERRNDERAPLLFIPPDDNSFWPTVGLLAVVLGIFVVAYILLRNH
jgi:pSer/pThr/pTyr-binding forkhead associated (FHA) protein